MTIRKKYVKHRFTVAELVVAMGVFALLSVMMLRVFSGLQTVCKTSSETQELMSDARVTLDLIEDDIRKSINLPTMSGVTQSSFQLPSGGGFFCTTQNDGKIGAVYYELASGDYTGIRKLNRKTAADYFASEPTTSNITNSALLLDNVLTFTITRYSSTLNGNNYNFSTITTDSVFPSCVMVELELILPERAEEYAAANAAKKTRMKELGYTRKFSRIIMLTNQ